MSITRAAVINGSTVANVIVLDTEGGWEPPNGQSVEHLPDDSPVGPDWRHNGSGFHAPPSLTVNDSSIPADGTTAATVTYKNTFDAPASVTFTVNGATQAVTPAAGVAVVEVYSTTPGDTIAVSVDALPGVSLTITVEG